MFDRPKSARSGNKHHRAFFGRVAGKRLHKGQRALFETLLPKVKIDFADELSPLAPTVPFENPDAPLVLEIGYGGGEHLARLATLHPDTNFVGAEVFTGGIGKMLEKIQAGALSNIRLYTEDAIVLLADLPDASLERVYLLYPDPWPKKRHHKRRFISNITLAELVRTLKPGGHFCFATDIEDYANWTLAHMIRQSEFNWSTSPEPQFWHAPFEGWQATRYEAKARREGRLNSFYFTFTRR